jgi:tRNA(fMet)-specific endonuclease VapC
VIRFLLDTDTLTLYLRGDANVLASLVRHLADEVFVSVITVEEVWDGWQAAVRKAKTPEEVGRAYDRLTATLNDLREWPVVSFPPSAVARYADLKKAKLNVGSNDLRIAAIALELGATVVTRNARETSGGCPAS